MYFQLQIYNNTFGWQDVYQTEDMSIEVEENSPVWDAEATTFSYPFQLPVEENRHIFGNVDTMHGSDVYSCLYGRRFRLYAGGLLLRSGLIHLDDEVQVEDGKIEIELVANHQELSEMLDGISCQDVDISDDKIQIGVALPQKKYVFFEGTKKGYKMTGGVRGSMVYSQSWTSESTFYLPRICVPVYYIGSAYATPDDFTNTQNAYDPSNPTAYPFCNVRVCYQKYEYKADDSGTKSWEAVHGYSVGAPDRVNSAPCFFVMYLLHKLFQLKGINVTENAMENYEDMKRLAFFHTNCEYDEVAYNSSDASNSEDDSWRYTFWGDARNKVNYSFRLEATSKMRVYPLEVGSDEVSCIDYEYTRASSINSPRAHAYANSKNFPDTDVLDVIEALQNAFSLRFMFDSNGQSLRIICVEDVLAQSGYKTLSCHVNSAVKRENSTRGYRLKYSSANEIPTNKITGAKERAVDDDETSYNYWDDRAATTFSAPDTTNGYAALVSNIGPYDTTYYVDTYTGNGYRIKVNSEADSDETLLYPSLFQVGGYRNAEYGDCSNDDFVKETSIGFIPVIENDVNGDMLSFAGDGESDVDIEPQLAQYVDIELHHNDDDSLIETAEVFTKSILKEQSRKKWGSSKEVAKALRMKLTFRMQAVESYEIASGGENPYDEQTPEFKLGIMRGSGADAGYTEYDPNYDGEGNYKWVMTSGTSAAFTSDSVDQYGNVFDYNGTDAGTGDSDDLLSKRISLKLKAEKPIRGDRENGYYDVTGPYCAQRGLFDKFHRRKAYWDVNAKVQEFEVSMELADLINLDFTQKYKIGNLVGFIRRVNYTLSASGLSPVTIQLLYL